MGKKIRVKTVVYDLKTEEWVQKNITVPISDELAAMLAKEISENLTSLKSQGHGTGMDSNKRIPGMKTPLADQKRYRMDTQFHILNEEDEPIGGWCNF